MKKGFIYLGAIITISLIAVVLAGLMLSLPKNEPIACTMEAKLCPDGSAVGRTGPRCEFAPCPVVDMTKVELEIINNFLTQWPQLQTALEVKPVLGSTTWFVDDIQFIGNNAILVAFEDGHIMPVAVYRYFGNNVFNYEAIYINDFPFSQNNWLSVVSQFGDVNYQASTYTKEVVRGTEIMNFDDWTKVPENKFIKTIVFTGQCINDADCKLIYSGCDCEAVPVSDARTYLESDLVCIRNGCMPPTEKISVCLNNKCVKKDK